MRFLTWLTPDTFKVSRRLTLDPSDDLTIVANTVTIDGPRHGLIAAGTNVQRSLRTILGGVDGDMLVLKRSPLSVGAPIIDDNAGNIQCAGNFTLDSPLDKMVLINDQGTWCELSRSNNA